MRIRMFAFQNGLPPFMTSVSLALLLSACSSGNGTPARGCPSAQVLSIAGYSTGTAPIPGGLPSTTGPYPTTATFLYFSAGNQSQPPAASSAPPTVTGVPTLRGSDGTTITGGTLTPVEAVEVLELTSLFGYSSSISGLKPNITYTVSFASLTGAPTGCPYGAQTAGSFQTS